jgi:hypothetical protein
VLNKLSLVGYERGTIIELMALVLDEIEVMLRDDRAFDLAASNKACALPQLPEQAAVKIHIFCPATIRLLAASDRLLLASLHCLSQAGCFQPVIVAGAVTSPQLTKTKNWVHMTLYP